MPATALECSSVYNIFTVVCRELLHIKCMHINECYGIFVIFYTKYLENFAYRLSNFAFIFYSGSPSDLDADFATP